MPRYFIEVSYHGASYAGFQKQQNAQTIQGEMEKALGIYFRSVFELTGSSRTDAGVHALQNFFHFDMEAVLDQELLTKSVYHLNAILPAAIVLKRIFPVAGDAHCRFDAVSRTYEYALYREKDPFLQDRAWFYPYQLDLNRLNAAAREMLAHGNFESFSKRNSQVHTYNCTILESEWIERDGMIIYRVTANRFLRGMVRGLTGTMLKVGRNKTDMATFRSIIDSRDASLVDFSVPPQGLILVKVTFP
jgi:tRNA pseudouridine38-40 synthase